MPAREVIELIRQADGARATGSFDVEIARRLQAFVASEATGEPVLDQIERAANLICDISDSMSDPTSSKEWEKATSHASSRHAIIEGGILELVKASQPERAFAISQRIKSPSLVRRLRDRTRSRDDLSAAARGYRDTLGRKEKALRALREAERKGLSERRRREMAGGLGRFEEELRRSEERLREEDLSSLASFGAPLRPQDLLPLLAPKGGCLVDLFLASGEAIALLAYRRKDQVFMTAMVAQDLDRNRLVEESQRWFQALASGRVDIAEPALDSLTQFLHDRMMCGLGAALRERGLWQITIVPHLMTHSLPLHLAPLCETGNTERFFEQFAVSYAPCVQLALSTALRPRPESFLRGQRGAALIADPSGDLPASRAELKAVRQELGKYKPAPPVHLFEGPNASYNNVKDELSHAALAVIATHARFSPGDPTGSGLRLADEDGGKTLASVDQIHLRWRLDNNPVVALSACESGMAHFDETSEIVSLPPALACVGAAAVLSSLWPVEDVSTSFLVERFVHHLLDPGETPATSLSVACQDVKKTTREAAVDRCDEILDEMADRDAQFGEGADAYVRLVSLKRRLSKGPERPFESPFFWGGFFITGAGWRLVGSKGVLARGPEATIEMALAIGKVREAAKLFRETKYKDAIRLLREAEGQADGLWLGRALLLWGDCLFRDPPQSALFNIEAYRKQMEEALDKLKRAHPILQAHNDGTAGYCANLIETINRNLGGGSP